MADRSPSPNARLLLLFSRFPAKVAAVAKQCLPRLRRALPGTVQLVYDYPHSVVVSFSLTEQGYAGIVGLAVDPRNVRLYVSKDVADPKGLLTGAGSKLRSATVERAADLDRGDLHDLLQAAIAHAGATFPAAQASRIVFKSDAKAKRTGATARAKARTSRARTTS
jgi:hypothetical protein